MHLAASSGASGVVVLGPLCLTASRATLGLIGISPTGVELLFLGGKGEFGATVSTLQRFVRKSHSDDLLSFNNWLESRSSNVREWARKSFRRDAVTYTDNHWFKYNKAPAKLQPPKVNRSSPVKTTQVNHFLTMANTPTTISPIPTIHRSKSGKPRTSMPTTIATMPTAKPLSFMMLMCLPAEFEVTALTTILETKCQKVNGPHQSHLPCLD
jgi:hypothetical protein